MRFPTAAFERFAQAAEVPSKDRGWTRAWPLFGGQRYGLREIANGWEQDIHNYLILSARQVGKTTAFVDLLGLFWPQRYDGITGIMVSDTDQNRDYRRDVHGQMLQRLPAEWKFPARLDNQLVRAWEGVGSRLMYEAVGSKLNKSFGRSRGINFLVADEVGAWEHQRAVQALNAALSDEHPYRLYVWNTTAQGHDIFRTMWDEAERSPVTRRIFLGWYLDERLQIPQTNRAVWDRYGSDGPTEDERTWMVQVADRYSVEVTPEQLVWYRAILDTKFYGDEDMRAQEYPCLPEEAFVTFGDKFFRPALVRHLREHATEAPPPKGFRYLWGRHLDTSHPEPCAPGTKDTLTVWEEPDPAGVYIVSCHPAFSSTATARDDVIQVWRAYPDKLEQAAEYVLEGGGLTRHCAWAAMHLAGAYRMRRRLADVYFIMDVEMTGIAVLKEIERFEQLGWGLSPQTRAAGRELEDLIGAVRHYFFRRPDSFGGTVANEWKSQHSFRPWLLNQLRDVVEDEYVEIRSPGLVEELAMVRRGEHESQGADVIAGGGIASDCRVIAAAMSVEMWLQTVQEEIRGRFPTKVQPVTGTHVGEVMVGNFLGALGRAGRKG